MSDSLTMNYTGRLVVTSCWCGVRLAIPEALERWARQRDDRSVFCPLGHKFVYGDTFEDQLARERRRHEATRSLLTQEERSHNATRGHLTRARKRAAAGVCPCCQRSFANVARHVASQHPDFKPEAQPS